MFSGWVSCTRRSLDSVDRTIKRPGLVARKFGHVIDYLARVELEVDRNVLELLVLLPDVDQTNKTFYADVWQPQEIQHGLILDRLQQDLAGPAPNRTSTCPSRSRSWERWHI